MLARMRGPLARARRRRPRPAARAALSGCPLSYRVVGELEAAPEEGPLASLWVAGGLYGNPEALRTLLSLVDEDAELARPLAGEGSVKVLFNGDFHFFDRRPEDWASIDETIRGHRHALVSLGNCEMEATRPTPGAGCGCAYPAYVADRVSVNADAIVAALAAAAGAAGAAAPSSWLHDQPRTRRFSVGGAAVGVVHGDPRSLSGWSLAVEQMEPPDEALRRRLGGAERIPLTPLSDVVAWLRGARVDVLACAHTCLPYAQRLPGGGVVVNNGAAGMPNFRRGTAGASGGLATRLSSAELPAHAGALYAVELPERGLRVEAVAVPYDEEAFLRWFLERWPEGSPAHDSYFGRLRDGVDGFGLRNAMRFS